MVVSLTHKHSRSVNSERSRQGNVNARQSRFNLGSYANTISTTVVMPITIVTTPTAPCRPLFAQISRRAKTASGTAVTIDNASMPLIEPIPNSAT